MDRLVRFVGPSFPSPSFPTPPNVGRKRFKKKDNKTESSTHLLRLLGELGSTDLDDRLEQIQNLGHSVRNGRLTALHVNSQMVRTRNSRRIIGLVLNLSGSRVRVGLRAPEVRARRRERAVRLVIITRSSVSDRVQLHDQVDGNQIELQEWNRDAVQERHFH